MRRITGPALCLMGVLLVVIACSGDDASVDGPVPAAPTTSELSGASPTDAVPDVAETPAATAAPSTAASPTSAAEPTSTVGPTDAEPVAIAIDALIVEAFPVPAGSRPHDVAPALDGGVWYTAQNLGELGWLDPDTGETIHIDLGDGARPHGVIVDARGVAWVTDSGLNAIVAVDPEAREPVVYPLPADRPNANLNTAAFDGEGVVWFTGQNGIYGSLDPATGEMAVYDSPRGRGPYGIAATPAGSVYLASLAGSYVGAIQPDSSLAVLEPPTAGQGARRVWSDSQGSIWVSEWNSGNLSRYVPSTGEWTTWPLPGSASTYAVYVDEMDIVWTSDFSANAMVRFDPSTEQFTQIPLPHEPGDIRQILGRAGEIWGAESAADHLVLIRTTE